MKRTSHEAPKKITSTSLEVGQTVKVVSGPLSEFDGVVSEVSPESGKVKVMVSIFGRETPVELSFDQVANYLILNAMRLTRPYVDGASRGGACHKLGKQDISVERILLKWLRRM